MNEGRLPAGLRLRVLAFAVDYAVIASYLAALVVTGVMTTRALPQVTRVLFGGPFSGELTGIVLVTLPVTLYFALQEASSRQATVGKRKMGLTVTDGEGGRLGLGRSVCRSVLKFVPWELAHACIWQITFARDTSSPVFVIGFALVWLGVAANLVSMSTDQSKRTLYDRLTGTMVVAG